MTNVWFILFAAVPPVLLARPLHRQVDRVMPPMRRRQLDQFVAAHAVHPVTARTGFAGAVHVAPAGPGRSSVTPTLPARTENEGEAS